MHVRSAMTKKRVTTTFEEIFVVQQGHFVPRVPVRLGTKVLEQGEPVHGSHRLDGIPLYALMGMQLEIGRIVDGIIELHVPLPAVQSGERGD